MMRKTTPHTYLTTYGPGIFTPEELEEAPEGSIFIDEEMNPYLKVRGVEWKMLDISPRCTECDFIECNSVTPVQPEMGLLLVKEKALPAMNRTEAIHTLAMRAIADHCDIQWDDSDVWRTELTIAGVISDSPHPLMLTEIHDLAYQITDALAMAGIIPAPRPKNRDKETS